MSFPLVSYLSSGTAESILSVPVNIEVKNGALESVTFPVQIT